MDAEYHEWAHSPSHLFKPNAFYFVTAGTYGRKKLFDTPDKRDFLLHSMFEEARLRGWQFEAWVVLSNHYHFVAMAPDDARTLRPMLIALHSKTAIWLNKLDNKAGRHVWYQYRDTCLTHERSYLARLNYVMQNPVKHGVVQNAANYRWCSIGWFTANAQTGFRRAVLSFPCDRVNIEDDF